MNDTTPLPIPEPNQGSQYLTVGEAAERLRVDPRTLRQAIDAGQIPAVRLGRAIRIPAGQI